MRQYFVTLLICLAAAFVNAQALRYPMPADYVALSAYSSAQPDAFGFTNNQAALAGLDELSFGVYGERKFMLAATSLYTGAVAIPSGQGNFGFNLKYSGFGNFSESQVGAAYAKRLSNKIDMGVQFNYCGYRVPGYLRSHAATVEIGAMVHLNAKLNVGLHVFNPIGGNFSKAEEKLASAYKVGIGYDPSDQVFVAAEIFQQEGCPLAVNAGLQYQFEQQFFLRIGVATGSRSGYAGAGVCWKNLRLDVTVGYHAQLGISPGLMLISGLRKK
ncbi:MAG: hypothetical protein Q7T76_10470 [Ferruginibacter sp.]|nr:hypothetical protein [Ferruginibacter sp.]